MNTNYYVMSDIHGELDKFEKALFYWQPDNEQLVLLGDYVDRGPYSMQVVERLIQLKQDHGDNVVILRGNHDENLAAWLLDTESEDLSFYYSESHVETLKSAFGFYHTDDGGSGKRKYKKSSRQQRAKHMRYKYHVELQFLAQLDTYYETDNIIFVHAGLNLNLKDWRKDDIALTNIRHQFYHSSQTAPKRTFFGHTPTPLIDESRHDSQCDPWFSHHHDKVGIDGGASMSGQLNVLRVNYSGQITESLAFK